MKPVKHIPLLFTLCLLATPFGETPVRTGASVTAGDVRFTVISPSCIRMEWSSERTFIDQPTFLAIERPKGYEAFTLRTDDGTLSIGTGELDLSYRLGSGDFTRDNLKITLRSGGVEWSLAAPRPTNLGGTVSSLNSYKGGAIPNGAGLLTKEGYYILKDESRLIDDTEWKWYESRPPGERRDWYFFGYGKDYAKAFRDFITLAGPVPLLPRKTFGFWWSKMSCGSEASVRELFENFDARSIPVDMLSFGMQWHINGWTGYAWETSAYPDPAAMMRWLHGRGLKVFQSHHYGGFRSNEPSFAMVTAATGLGANDTFDFAVKSHAQAFMDYVAEPIEQIGCDHWWLDGYFPGPGGMDGQAWSNHVYMTHMSRTRPNLRQMILSRWGGWGSHRYPVQFSGDVISNWESLEGEVNFTAKSGNAMAGYWSHDIGGYKGLGSNSRLYTRWSQFATFSPIYRYHSSGEERRPWMFGEEAERVVTRFIRLRQQLVPYLYTLAREYHDTGLPPCRPLFIRWPEEQTAYSYQDRYAEYMLGNDLLVAPVHSPDDTKELWFPPDYWTDIFTGTTYQGPSSESIVVPLDRAPVFARSGTIIPLQPVMAHSSERPLDTLLLKVFPPVDKAGPARSALYEDDGETMAFTEGNSARTRFTQAYVGDASARALAITLGAAEGRYQGMPEQRTFILEIYNVRAEPSGVTVAGSALTAKASESALRTGPGYFYRKDAQRLFVSAESPSGSSLELRVEGFIAPSATVEVGRPERVSPRAAHIAVSHAPSGRTLKISGTGGRNLSVTVYTVDGRRILSRALNRNGPTHVALSDRRGIAAAGGAVIVRFNDLGGNASTMSKSRLVVLP